MTQSEARAWLLERARREGVDLEVLATRERTLSVEARSGRASDASLAEQGGIGLRVVKDGRAGYSSTEEFSEEALEWAFSEAVANAGLQDSDHEAFLPAASPAGRHDLLGEGLSVPLEEKADAAISLEQGISSDGRVQALQFARYSESQTELEIGSTRGADGGYRHGYASLVSAVVMREGESVKQGWHVDVKPAFHALEPGRTAQEALEVTGRHLGARSLSTGRRRAILEPEVTATLLQLLLFSLSGKNLAEGRSLLAGKLGQRVAAPGMTVVDDPLLAGGVASRPFDSEGTPSQRLVLIEDGILRSFLHNSETAARTGQENTGHAGRSYRSTLDVAPSNFFLEAGAGVTRTDGTIIVTDVMGVHAGANPLTGDVSVQAMGLEVTGAETVPVDNFAISFSLFALLGQVEEVGTDFGWWPGFSGICGAPSIAVADVSFGGS